MTVRIQDGFVLGLHRDDVLALFGVEVRRALQGQVVRLGRAGRPHDLFRISVHQRGDLLTRTFHCLIRSPTKGVRTRGGIAELLSEIWNHHLGHTRVYRRGRGVIHIDG
ncbi:MAG: hypothetical protein FD121_1487 [Gallionellaceae bacterium]|nr:MAG: hypothetical protein FD121_1487 [Gallionellaceae bacterium]